jgi:hypothetical protein
MMKTLRRFFETQISRRFPKALFCTGLDFQVSSSFSFAFFTGEGE